MRKEVGKEREQQTRMGLIQTIIIMIRMIIMIITMILLIIIMKNKYTVKMLSVLYDYTENTPA